MTLEIGAPEAEERPARKTRDKAEKPQRAAKADKSAADKAAPEKAGPARRKKDSAPAPREAAPREEIAREQPRHEETRRDRGQSNERRRDYRSEPPSAPGEWNGPIPGFLHVSAL
jgi:hypothetical protein